MPALLPSAGCRRRRARPMRPASRDILSSPFCSIFCGRARSLPPSGTVKVTHPPFPLQVEPFEGVYRVLVVAHHPDVIIPKSTDEGERSGGLSHQTSAGSKGARLETQSGSDYAPDGLACVTRVTSRAAVVLAF